MSIQRCTTSYDVVSTLKRRRVSTGFVPIPQISFLLEAVFSIPSRGNISSTNPSLQPVATDFLFNENDILSFIFSLKSLLPLEGDQC